MWIVLLLIGVLPLKQHPLWSRFVGDLTVVKYVGLAAFLYALVHLVRTRRLPRYLRTWQARFFACFAAVILFSYIYSDVQFTRASNPMMVFSSLCLMWFILASVLDTEKRLRWVVLTVVGSLAWASLYVLREWQKAHGWETGHRPGWVVGDSNHFAVSAIAAVPLAWHFASRGSSAWERWFFRIALGVILLAVILGASRGGVLGLGTAMAFIALRARKRVTNIAAALLIFAGLNLAYPHSPVRRLLNPNRNDVASEENHRASWVAGLRMVRQHPLAGVGVGAFRPNMLKYAPQDYDGAAFQAHSAYISVAAETGIPGLVLFLGTLAATYISLGRVQRDRSISPLVGKTARALQASLAGSAVSIAFISAEHHQHLWLIVFISMCLPSIASNTAIRARVRRDLFEPSAPASAGAALCPSA